MRQPLTPSQTVGPYLHIGLDWLNTTELAVPGVAGQRIALHGQLVDADGVPVPDGLIEIWQANADGHYAHPDDHGAGSLDARFTGFGRCPTDAEGRFHFSTIKPGSVPTASGLAQAPHIMVHIFARGLLKQLVTRVYFAGDDQASDPVLQQVPAARRHTLIAVPAVDQPDRYTWQIVLQGGSNETVFFAL